MASLSDEIFDVIGELILMKEESKEDEEHVRGLEKTLIEYLDENKIILDSQHFEAIRHLNIDRLIESQLKIIDNCIEENNKLIEAMKVCPGEDCPCSCHTISKSLHNLSGSNFFHSWNFTSDPCGFAGVYCDGDKNFISGEIPASLGEVHRLRTFDLSYNQLAGTISPSIGSLPELSNLILRHNHLTRSIPPFLSQSLTRIDLKRNSLTDSISPSVVEIFITRLEPINRTG
ncbi:hypothetical protein HID58_006768 [Brassica napus]|uniref:Leucine-rich repeat-containing N-terminal plant-type domain-containing protein n=1 Tax=Brassica napus TaxID=3708 RepID=A0ABQ8ED75_BRANA|nr:hypothetical protein HID58_006768 [Brassica napus]